MVVDSQEMTSRDNGDFVFVSILSGFTLSDYEKWSRTYRISFKPSPKLAKHLTAEGIIQTTSGKSIAPQEVRLYGSREAYYKLDEDEINHTWYHLLYHHKGKYIIISIRDDRMTEANSAYIVEHLKLIRLLDEA